MRGQESIGELENEKKDVAVPTGVDRKSVLGHPRGHGVTEEIVKSQEDGFIFHVWVTPVDETEQAQIRWEESSGQDSRQKVKWRLWRNMHFFGVPTERGRTQGAIEY